MKTLHSKDALIESGQAKVRVMFDDKDAITIYVLNVDGQPLQIRAFNTSLPNLELFQEYVPLPRTTIDENGQFEYDDL